MGQYVPAQSSELRKEWILGRKSKKVTIYDPPNLSPNFGSQEAADDYVQVLQELQEEDLWLRDIIGI